MTSQYHSSVPIHKLGYKARKAFYQERDSQKMCLKDPAFHLLLDCQPIKNAYYDVSQAAKDKKMKDYERKQERLARERKEKLKLQREKEKEKELSSKIIPKEESQPNPLENKEEEEREKLENEIHYDVPENWDDF